MNPLVLTAMVEVFLLAMVRDDSVRRAASVQWLYLGVAAVGAALAATLLV